MDPAAILQQYWGYSGFRSCQEVGYISLRSMQLAWAINRRRNLAIQ